MSQKNKPTYRETHGKTRVGNFLEKIGNVAPELIEAAGQITGVKALEELGKRLDKDPSIDPADKEIVRAFIEQDIEDAREVTKRWESDNLQESWLPRNIRPLTLISIVCFTLLMILLDSFELALVKDKSFDYLEMVSITVVGAYFGLRTYDKHSKNKHITR